MKRLIIYALAVTLLTACATKTAVTSGGKSTTTDEVPTAQQNQEELLRREQIAFVQKVTDKAAYQKDVVSKLTFTLNSGSKNISVPGSIHMRKDDVIRIQLMVPLLGTEVGRLEFTKDYVLIIDRLHKQYIKGDYNQVSFLRNHGITFYSLQALFWNQLFLPGEKKVTDSEMKNYTVDLHQAGDHADITLLQQNILYQWQAGKTDGNITDAHIAYQGNDGKKAELNWRYGDFRSFGSKLFPHQQRLNFKMDQKDVTVTLDMNGVTADSNWDTRTTVSDRYKEVSVEEVLKQLTSL